MPLLTLLSDLERSPNSITLWNKLLHRVSRLSARGSEYAVLLPRIVIIGTAQQLPPAQLLSIVGRIDLARREGQVDPPLDGLDLACKQAVQMLALRSLQVIQDVSDPEHLLFMLAIVALWKDLFVHGIALLEYSGEELSGYILPQQDDQHADSDFRL